MTPSGSANRSRNARSGSARSVASRSLRVIIAFTISSQFRAHVPELREERDVEHLAEITHSDRAARPAFATDDALHRRHVSEAPLLKPVLEVDQLLHQLIGIPVPLQTA